MQACARVYVCVCLFDTFGRFPMLFILADVTATAAFHTYIPLSYRVVQKEATCQYQVTFTALYLQQVDDFQIVSNAAKYIFAYLPLLAGVCTNVALYLALQHESRTHLSLCAVHQGAPLRKKMLVQRQLALAILVRLPFSTSEVRVDHR